MESASLIAIIAVVGSFGATVAGPFLSYRAGNKKAPAEIDSEVSKASRELVDASTVVVALLRDELSSLKEKLDELNEGQKITNGKGYPEPVLPLIYENQSIMKDQISELREKAEQMGVKQDANAGEQARLKEQTEQLGESLSGFESYFSDFMKVWKHNVKVAQDGGTEGLQVPEDFRPSHEK